MNVTWCQPSQQQFSMTSVLLPLSYLKPPPPCLCLSICLSVYLSVSPTPPNPFPLSQVSTPPKNLHCHHGSVWPVTSHCCCSSVLVSFFHFCLSSLSILLCLAGYEWIKQLCVSFRVVLIVFIFFFPFDSSWFCSFFFFFPEVNYYLT